MKTKLLFTFLAIIILFELNTKAQTNKNFFDDKILIVLHMQEDSIDSPCKESDLKAINNMNEAIEAAPTENVVYVKANHKILNLTLKKIYVSENINELNDKLHVVNDNIFIDEGYDAFKSDELREFIDKSNIMKLIFIGQSAEACLKKSVLSGLKKGYEVYMIPDAIIGHTDDGKSKALSKLMKKGVKELVL